MISARAIFLAFGLGTSPAAAQAVIGGPLQVNLSATVGSPLSVVAGSPVPSVAGIGIGAFLPGIGGPVAVKFEYVGVKPASTLLPIPPNFVVVSPSNGTTSSNLANGTGVLVGLNQSVVRTMSSGNYALIAMFSTVDQSPPSTTGVLVLLHLSAPPPAIIESVVNDASRQPAISPGTVVSISGSNLGPDIDSTQYDDTGSYPTELVEGNVKLIGATALKFSGIPAPLLYVSPNRIKAIVPYGVAGQNTADVVLSRYGRSTAPFTVQVLDTSPAIFTVDHSGSGQGVISNLKLAGSTILPGNAQPIIKASPNSAANPAPKGFPISLWATGGGVWNPGVPAEGISLIATNSVCTVSGDPACRKLAAGPISLTIGGQPARIVYVGAIPYQPWGVFQIDAFVPDGVDSGPQPVVLTIGQNDNSQQAVTVAID